MLKGLGEAGFVSCGNFDAILNDKDLHREFLEGGFTIRADDFVTNEHAEVALPIEKREDVLGSAVLWDRNGEEDENLIAGEIIEAPIEN